MAFTTLGGRCAEERRWEQGLVPEWVEITAVAVGGVLVMTMIVRLIAAGF
ncbi:hypothetical protein [Muricoccus radiodurans]